MFSPPRPIVFYERTSLLSKEKIVYYEKSKLVEIHAYLSLIQALEERLFAAIRNNELGIVFPDSFFLLSHDDLIVIVHVISLTNNSCSFECRCLEYEQTTSCHRNERTNIELIASEENTFGNILHSLYYRRSSFELVTKSLELESLSMSQILTENIVPIISEHIWKWFFLSSAVIASQTSFSANGQENIEFSSEQLATISFLADYYHHDQKDAIKQTSFIYEFFINRINDVALIKEELTDYFNGNVGYPCSNYITKAVQLSVVFIMMDSADCVPDDLFEDHNILIDFVKECLSTKTYNINDDSFINHYSRDKKQIVMMHSNEE